MIKNTLSFSEAYNSLSYQAKQNNTKQANLPPNVNPASYSYEHNSAQINAEINAKFSETIGASSKFTEETNAMANAHAQSQNHAKANAQANSIAQVRGHAPALAIGQMNGQANAIAQSRFMGNNQASNIGANALDPSSFASELQSPKMVSALMGVNHQISNSPLGPTLQDRGAHIDRQGNITIPNNAPQIPTEQNTQTKSQTIGMPINSTSTSYLNQASINKKNVNITQEDSRLVSSQNQGIDFSDLRGFALDNRSLGVLSRISNRKERQAEANQQDLEVRNSSILSNNPPKNLHLASSLNSDKSMGNTLSDAQKINVGGLSENPLGQLSKQYESASKGSFAIGYDRNGGTSYGSYQISSRAGTFDQFLKFLDKNEPEFASTLRKAGAANTGSRSGAMPNAWKGLCEKNPERMAELEHNFIVQTHYKPVADYVERTWEGGISPALREVIFSTAVQHGVNGAKRVFNQAFADTKSPVSVIEVQANKAPLIAGESNTKEALTASIQSQEELIKNIYNHRSTKFGSSTSQVQASARNRFIHEQNEALKILG